MSSQISGNDQNSSLVFGQPIIFKQLLSSESTGLVILFFQKYCDYLIYYYLHWRQSGVKSTSATSGI